MYVCMYVYTVTGEQRRTLGACGGEGGRMSGRSDASWALAYMFIYVHICIYMYLYK